MRRPRVGQNDRPFDDLHPFEPVFIRHLCFVVVVGRGEGGTGGCLERFQGAQMGMCLALHARM